MKVHIFIGDIDEFNCDAVSGEDRRWAVWKSDREPLDHNDPRRERGIVNRFVTTLIGRFDTENEALQFANDYDVGTGKIKVII